MPAITDGPYAEAKEHLGGYLMVECETPRARGRDRPALAELALHAAGGATAHEPRRGRDVSTDAGVEDLLRALAPQVLGALVRRHGQFDACEDAVQEALIAAAAQWPRDGVPDNPRAWLLTVAGRRLIDAWRSDSARRAREDGALAAEPHDARVAPGADADVEALDADAPGSRTTR